MLFLAIKLLNVLLYLETDEIFLNMSAPTKTIKKFHRNTLLGGSQSWKGLKGQFKKNVCAYPYI